MLIDDKMAEGSFSSTGKETDPQPEKGSQRRLCAQMENGICLFLIVAAFGKNFLLNFFGQLFSLGGFCFYTDFNSIVGACPDIRDNLIRRKSH